MQGSLARPYAALLLVIVCCAGALLLLVAASHDARAVTADFGVYFEPESVPEDQRLNISTPAFAGLGFQIVRTADDFSAALARATPDSIWIHRTALEAAPAGLLRRLKRQGVVMVGIETTEVELARLLAPVPSSGGDWRHPTEATFAIYWEYSLSAATPGIGQGSHGGWTWTVMSFDLADPAPLVYVVQRAIEERDRSATPPGRIRVGAMAMPRPVMPPVSDGGTMVAAWYSSGERTVSVEGDGDAVAGEAWPSPLPEPGYNPHHPFW